MTKTPTSNKPFVMDRISIGLNALETEHFDAIVVGSGYGGGVAASRLSRAGRKVCVLERGREILPGAYPNSITSAMAETQITASQVGCLTPGKNGMLDIRINDDINVVVGCGLGGTSLINANVSLETDPRTFDDPRWPVVFREDGTLEPYYEMARQMLGAKPLPPQYNPNKLQALQASAKYMGATFERPPINVTFEDGENAAGVAQAACNMCGDCCSGCNYGAKNTTLMNYLPDAAKHGAVIVTEAEVVTVLPADQGRWSVTVNDKSRKARDAVTLTAETVVLGAGTLGSTEIMLRSAKAGLPVSAKNLGKGFSGNGDVLAFGFDANWKQAKDADERAPVYGIGAGANLPSWDTPQFMPGPCITGVIKVDMEPGKPGKRGLVIEEGVAPGALAMVYAAGFFMEESLHGDLFRFPDAEMRLMDIKAIGETFQSGKGNLPDMAYDGPISRTQTFLLMSHDTSDGVIEYDEVLDHVTVSWPGVGGSTSYLHDNDELRDACDGIWANYLENPISLKPLGEKLVTVHPVGGCRMGDTGATGVVSDRCAVFTGEDGTEAHDGLYVCDGSVMPTSLGLNPLLTISAVAERAMDLLIKEKGWVSGPSAHVEAKAVLSVAPAPAADAMTPKSKSDEPAFLATVIGRLDQVREQLGSIRKLSKSDLHAAEKAARAMLDELIDNYGPESKLKRMALKASVWTSVTENEVKKDIVPAIDEILEVLDHVSTLLHNDEAETPWTTRLEQVIGYLSDDVGDFSPEISFDETMSGHVSAPLGAATGMISNAYDICARAGATRPEGAMTGSFRIVAASADEVLSDKAHAAALEGEVICGMLPGGTMRIKHGSGTFELLKQDAAHVESWQMIYTGTLEADGAEPHFFRGVKTLQRRTGSDWWTDLTTLSVDVWQGQDESGTHVAKGVITLGLQQLAKQVRTVSADFDGDDGGDIVKQLFTDLLIWGNLHTELAKPEIRKKILRRILTAILSKLDAGMASKVELAISMFFGKRLATFFAMLVFRTYGGFLAYMKNFPATDPQPVKPMPEDGDRLREGSDIEVKGYPVVTSDGATLQLLRARGGKNGPVLLAPGFATKAASFAMRTVDRNFVEMLCADGFDVWMLDYRGSPALGATSLTEFNIDDVAQKDWPAAVDVVLEETGADAVQIVAHCMGSMSCLMALLCGALDKAKVRSVISSQLTVHPVTNWFNQMKSDTRVTAMIRNGVPQSLHGLVEQVVPSPAMAELFFGLDTIDANSTAALPPIPGQKATQEQDQAIDLLTWKVPFPNEEPCYNPTCHRLYGIYGPIYLHRQLNEATHDAIKDVVGRISTRPFLQIAQMMRSGEAVSESGENIYLPHHANLDMPITFIAGALNEEFLPDTSLRTFRWLKERNPQHSALYHRHVFSDYGHMDCFIGRNASRDIFPFVIERLKTPVPGE